MGNLCITQTQTQTLAPKNIINTNIQLNKQMHKRVAELVTVIILYHFTIWKKWYETFSAAALQIAMHLFRIDRWYIMLL